MHQVVKLSLVSPTHRSNTTTIPRRFALLKGYVKATLDRQNSLWPFELYHTTASKEYSERNIWSNLCLGIAKFVVLLCLYYKCRVCFEKRLYLKRRYVEASFGSKYFSNTVCSWSKKLRHWDRQLCRINNPWKGEYRGVPFRYQLSVLRGS